MAFSSKRRGGVLASLWTLSAKAEVLSPPALCDIDGDGSEEILVGTTDGRLLCIDQAGKVKWTFDERPKIDAADAFFLDDETGFSINSTPVCADLQGDGNFSVIFGTEQGQIIAIDATGKKQWVFQCGGPIRGDVLCHDINDDNEKEIIAGSSDGFLYVLTQDGKLIHRFDANAPIESSPEFFEGRIVFGCSDGVIYCIKQNGEVLWDFKTRGKITARPLVARIFNSDRRYFLVGSKDNCLYTLDLHGNLEWKYATEGAIMSSPVITMIGKDREVVIVVGSCDNKVHAISAKGDKLWTYETDFWIVASPSIIDIDGDGKKEVLAGSYDHNLYILDSEGEYVLDYMPGISGVVHQAGHYTDVLTSEAGKQFGKRIWQLRMPGVVIGCTPVAQGKVLLTTKNGDLVLVGHNV